MSALAAIVGGTKIDYGSWHQVAIVLPDKEGALKRPVRLASSRLHCVLRRMA